MDLKQFVMVLLRCSWLIVLGGMLGGAAGFFVSKQMDPIYEASTTLLIDQTAAASGSGSLFTATNLTRTVQELLRTPSVFEAVIEKLQLGIGSEALGKRISLTASPRDSQLIALTVKDTDSQRAADIANQIVKVFTERNRELQARRYAQSRQTVQDEIASTLENMGQTQKSLDVLKARIGPGQSAESGPLAGDERSSDVPAEAPVAPGQAVEQLRLQSLLTHYQSNYQTLLQSREKLRMAEIQPADIVLVVEPARPAVMPAAPRQPLNTALAAILGVLSTTGGISILWYWYLGRQVRPREEVARWGRVPVQPAVDATDDYDRFGLARSMAGGSPSVATGGHALEL